MLNLLLKPQKAIPTDASPAKKRWLSRKNYARSYRALLVDAPEKCKFLVGKEAVASNYLSSLELEFEDGGVLTTSSIQEVSENVMAKTITYRTKNSTYTVKVLELL